MFYNNFSIKFIIELNKNPDEMSNDISSGYEA